MANGRCRRISRWVELKAPWPEDRGPGALAVKPSRAPGTDHWAFRPLTDPRPPAVRDAAWVRTPVDPFVLARLEAEGWSPSPPADRRTLIRRATFDLIGLPPTPQDIDAFLADNSSDAFAKVLDRLLASPQ